MDSQHHSRQEAEVLCANLFSVYFYDVLNRFFFSNDDFHPKVESLVRRALLRCVILLICELKLLHIVILLPFAYKKAHYVRYFDSILFAGKTILRPSALLPHQIHTVCLQKFSSQ